MSINDFQNMDPLPRGRLIARWLARSWQSALPEPDFTLAPPDDIAAFLLKTGAGALAWARLRGSKRTDTSPLLDPFRQAYRLHVVQAALHECNLRGLIRELNRHSIPFLLTKGWTVARAYPEPGLRPYGDIDLAVPPKRLERVHQILLATKDRYGPVDLHPAVPDLPDRTWEQLWNRRQQIGMDGALCCCLGREDQLRHLCLHAVRHGMWRPLWLCDVAVLLDKTPADFDWSLCLDGLPWQTDWVLAAFGLASRLLGTTVRQESIARRADALAQRWEAVVLREWGSFRQGDSHNRDRRPIASYLRRPSGIAKAIQCRWPNPIEAAFKTGASPHSRIPQWVRQAAAFGRRAWAKRNQMFGRRAGIASELHPSKVTSFLTIHRSEQSL
jgi:hypothetical protein